MIELASKLIQNKFSLPHTHVFNTLKLLSEGATIAFIARYRKEMTGSLDEVNIEKIKNEFALLDNLSKRKTSIIKSIEEQGKMTPALFIKINECWETSLLEDLYLPFKKKSKTKATVARENGLEALAKIITDQNNDDVIRIASRFLNKNIKTEEQALEGARHIISEWISENIDCREILRLNFNRTATISSKLVKSKKADAHKYEMYFDYSEKIQQIPSHRLLALFRGEQESFLKLKLKADTDLVLPKIDRLFIKKANTQSSKQIALAIDDALSRLLIPSIENEIKKAAKLKADQEAIQVFGKNLKDLLLASPLGSKTVLSIDPGFRTGCKLVVLNNLGDLVYEDIIYPNPPQSKTNETINTLQYLVDKFDVEAIAIGNGTGGKECYQLVSKITFDKKVDLFFVNESGASIYSASKVARDEFPDKDVTVRGAVSIGRRLMDPLAELVKIDPKSIGVGQYQHDVNQVLLKESLDATVSSCVNSVGINLNTASQHLLMHVSGLGPGLALNIVNYRTKNGPFKKRKALLKVPRMGDKAFEQCAGFLRIKNAKYLLDNTGVHPESYEIVEQMAKDLNVTLQELIENKDLQNAVDLKQYISDKVGLPTLRDIMLELKKPGLDPRGMAESVKFSNTINSISDLAIGMTLPGIVNNVTKFGAFVDIGIKESGLVHVSEITHKFIDNVSEILSVNQEVSVKVIAIDTDKKRISLSIKQV